MKSWTVIVFAAAVGLLSCPLRGQVRSNLAGGLKSFSSPGMADLATLSGFRGDSTAIQRGRVARTGANPLAVGQRTSATGRPKTDRRITTQKYGQIMQSLLDKKPQPSVKRIGRPSFSALRHYPSTVKPQNNPFITTPGELLDGKAEKPTKKKGLAAGQSMASRGALADQKTLASQGRDTTKKNRQSRTAARRTTRR